MNVCPRCAGVLLRATDRYGRYRSCLSCGNVVDPSRYLTQAEAEAEIEAEDPRRGARHNGIPL